ncbi:MAG: hypothetical protein QW059_05210 [Nitrososphaerota archaeon]
MSLLYRLGLLAAILALVVAGVVLLSDWPVGLGEYAMEVCREVPGDALGGGGRVVCEERRFSVLRGSPLSGALGAALLALALSLIVVLTREYFVRSFEYLTKRLGKKGS